MGIIARLTDANHPDTDLRVGPTYGGAMEFSIGNGKLFERVLVKHEDLDDVITFCDQVKKQAEILKAIENPK